MGDLRLHCPQTPSEPSLDHLERERYHLTFLHCHWATCQGVGFREKTELAKRQGRVWPAGTFWGGGALRFEECPSNHSNTAFVLAQAGLLPATSCHTALLWDILKSPPLWGCQPLTWSSATLVQAGGRGRGGAQARGAGTAMGQSGKPMKKPWASQKEQSQSLGSCSRHTKRTQVRALGLGFELQLPTLKAWLLGFGFFCERWGLWGQGPQNSRATTKGSPRRYRYDSSLE